MADVKVAMSKKGMLIVLVIGVLLLGGGGAYLLWRVNQKDTVAPIDSDASEHELKCKEPIVCRETPPAGEEEQYAKICTMPEGVLGYCKYERVVTAYHITYSADAGGTVTNAGQNSVSPGGSISSTATPNSGYEFVKWSDNKTTAARTDSNVQADATYTATFQKEPETNLTLRGEVVPAGSGDVVKVESSGDVVITNQSVTLKQGDSYTLTARPNTGYTFDKWTKKYPPSEEVLPTETQSTEATRTGRIDKNIILIANFSRSSSNTCGDGVCSGDETPASCPADCNGGGSDTVPDTAIFEDTKDTIIFGIVVLMIGIGWTWLSTLPKRAYSSISKVSAEIISNSKETRERNTRESRRDKLERRLK